MTQFNEVAQPIICDAYRAPTHHWEIERGQPPIKAEGRREACYYYRPPGRSTAVERADEIGTRTRLDLVNEIRKRVGDWRAAGFPGVTGTTAELLAYWSRPDRERRLFFCQREAMETIVFLVEAREDFRQGLAIPRDEPGQFIRYACKMATGTGKTAVMAGLAAWTILSKVADRGDRRFSDVVLVVCPNVTIRDRLDELKPERGEGSVYRIRDIVPAHLMADLRKGHVLVTNWHTLAPQDLNQVGGVGARVVKRGQESDTAVVARVLGRKVGGKGNVLVLNDEAHHAYRIRHADDTPATDGDEELFSADRREATVWIEGLDRIERVRGINLCVDLSATPFYLDRAGSDPGRPFPWVVSDFGLIDAIESGLVKIPQLPVQDTTGAEIPAYFNVWKWIVEEKLTPGERGGRRGQLKPEAVLRWAQQPIAQLAGLWRQSFLEWQRDAAEGRRPPVPPVFIVVCRDTRLAKVVYEWITGEGDTPPPVEEFKNQDGREFTVRVDSRVVEDLATGVAKTDESKRLRFVLATIGKTAWPGGTPPEEYLDLVDKLNRKAAEEGGLRIDGSIPPGRDVRCIVSVAMLTEGWDATTVTHIVGLRPFESQLLCEQVIGRGLRRSQYHDLTVEEVAKVYGVPFELIPLKATPGTPTPPPRVHHVYALSPERDGLDIRFPRVDGYTHRVTTEIQVTWDRVPSLVLDPAEVPDETLVKALTTDRGQGLSLLGPGTPEHLTLDAWRVTRRLQEVEFTLARALTKRYVEDPAGNVPAQAVFPQMLRFSRRFLREKVEPLGHRDRKDVLLNPYFSRAVEALNSGIGSADPHSREVPRYEANREPGSTRQVDFWTSKPVRETQRSHLNFVVADTDKWEQSTAFYLETDPHVLAYVKNFNLGFAIPYMCQGETREYLPDFLVRLHDAGHEIGTLILETKGYDPLKHAKLAGAERWVAAVNTEGAYGRWVYRVVTEPARTPHALRSAVEELSRPPVIGDWRAAVKQFTDGVKELYGPKLHSVIVYGSRARGDAQPDSDIDVLVALHELGDSWEEAKRMGPLATEASLAHDVLLTVLPADARQVEGAQTPLLVNVRREGIRFG